MFALRVRKEPDPASEPWSLYINTTSPAVAARTQIWCHISLQVACPGASTPSVGRPAPYQAKFTGDAAGSFDTSYRRAFSASLICLPTLPPSPSSPSPLVCPHSHSTLCCAFSPLSRFSFSIFSWTSARAARIRYSSHGEDATSHLLAIRR